jgi:hypothetical protein
MFMKSRFLILALFAVHVSGQVLADQLPPLTQVEKCYRSLADLYTKSGNKHAPVTRRRNLEAWNDGMLLSTMSAKTAGDFHSPDQSLLAFHGNQIYVCPSLSDFALTGSPSKDSPAGIPVRLEFPDGTSRYGSYLRYNDVDLNQVTGEDNYIKIVPREKSEVHGEVKNVIQCTLAPSSKSGEAEAWLISNIPLMVEHLYSNYEKNKNQNPSRYTDALQQCMLSHSSSDVLEKEVEKQMKKFPAPAHGSSAPSGGAI